MKKYILISFFSVVLITNIKAQGGFSFYQLRDVVPQTQSVQPAFIQNNTFTFGLSGAQTTFQGDFELGDILYKSPSGGGNFSIDFNNLLENTAAVSQLNLDATANVVTIGFKSKWGSFSLFGNVRTKLDFEYDDDIIEFLANGNSNRIGSSLNFENTKISLDTYHEFGLGFARTFLKEKLTLGVRAKMINGIFHVSTEDGAQASIATDATTYDMTFSIRNARVRTAGLNMLFNSDDYDDNALQDYAVSNGNNGFAFDFGAKYDIFDYLSVEFSVLDLGNITWKEEVINYQADDADVTFRGVPLRGIDDIDQVLEDSLLGKFTSEENYTEFKKSMSPRTYLAVSYKPGVNDRFTLMAYNNHVFNEIKPAYSLSYNRSAGKFTFGAITTYRSTNSRTNFGFNMAANLGPVQLYMATDNLLVVNQPEKRSIADVRFGLNLMIGYKKWKNPNAVVNLDEL
jgi:Family of unknown function (DUF5723)